jgi:hypothetical protein
MTEVLSHKQIKRQQHNMASYQNNINNYKLAYYFRTYPYIQTKHATEIAEYLKTNGEKVDEKFIEFIRTFVIPNKRPTEYKPRVAPTKKRLPKVLQTILIKTNYDSSSSDDSV